jgi:predicted nucleotidyltransferase/DNA-binding Xre family transcriptional regulator
MEKTTALGERIRSLRREAGVTATKLASAAGVTENAIRKIEAGTSAEPRFLTGVRIARALGVSPLILAGDTANASGAPELARIIQAIRSIREKIEAEGIEHVDIFGSVARGDATPESDVDVILTPKPDARFTLFNLNGAGNRLEDALGRKVDVITRHTAENSKRLGGVVEESVRAF